MKKSGCHENHPVSTVIQSALATLALYACGAIVICKAGWIWCSLYIVFIVGLEIRLLKKSCIHCYYYGKTCAFGRGRLCRILFKQGNSEIFAQKKITWMQILPDLLVALIPILAGFILILIDFSWMVLIMVLLLIFLTAAGNGYIRGKLACNHCKQIEIGCPAMEFFG